jgi:hypothetical protein
VQGLTTGTGIAGSFQVTNTSNSMPALEARTTGTGPAMKGIGGFGPGGFFLAGDGRAALFAEGLNAAAASFQARGSSNQYALIASGNFAQAIPLAAFFQGNVHVNGTLTKTAGSFRIDHPLDPEHKYLSHSFVESPDMKNVYDGTVTLDANGRAMVELPDYFEALNRDFRYQLTAIGAPGPNLYIAEGVKQNRFQIAGGRPYARVSWMVTGVRQDSYANEHRIKVEEEKPRAEGELVTRR